MMYLLLVLGFALLIKGADFFVDGASSVAKLLKIPSVIVGLTIVAIGTSLPELSVSLSASLAGNNDISLSNVVGSNIFNLLVVVGVSAAICPMLTEKIIVKRDIWWSFGAAAALLLMMIDGVISRIEGIVLVAALVAYILVLIRYAQKNRLEGDEIKSIGPLKTVIFLILGPIAIIYGGDLVVDNATLIAKTIGMSDTFIGLTIVALGTSLPELVTSIVAARKGDSGLALGNVVGSNIFNILMIVGTSAAITGAVHSSVLLMIDTALLLGATLIMYFICRSSEKINRWEGVACVLMYIAYTVYITIR